MLLAAEAQQKTEGEGTMPELSQFKAEFFKALAHPLRIRIIDALRGGEVGVNELSTRLGVEQTTLSQQLAMLRTRNLVVGRKNGSNVFYSVRDPGIFRLLDVAREIFNNQLIDVRDLLSQVEAAVRS
jgi:ArsR family transcriptional regulator